MISITFLALVDLLHTPKDYTVDIFLKITMKKKTLLHYNRSFYGIAEYNESLNNILDHIWQISLI